MNKNSNGAALLVFVVFFGSLLFLSSIFAIVAVVSGILRGGGVAIKNYVQSLKENMM